MRSVTALAATLALATGCGEETSPEYSIFEGEQTRVPVIESQIVSTADVWAQIDTSRTYWSLTSNVHPESLIVELWQAELSVTRAWQPLDDRCFNPIGPRFTVELAESDERILKHDFDAGPGFILCSTTLEQYTVSE
ncbi:MAG: hypothetical protein PVG79_17320 [Gemmatimonadales bacterium]|jgi:hypothetical protein